MEIKRTTLSLLVVLTVLLSYTPFVTTSYAQQSTEELSLVVYAWPSPLERCTRLAGGFRSHGTAAINLGAASAFVNGVSAPLTVSTPILMPSQGTTFVITTTSADYVQGATYPLKIVTLDGGVFSFSVKCGGTGMINVTVVNATDETPLEGVVVSLFTPSLYSLPSYGLLFSGLLVESQTTDSSGHTVFTGLADGDYDINATLWHYGQTAGTGATIADGGTVNVELRVYQTYGLSTLPLSVTVWVQDRTDGTYISFALVKIEKTATGWTQQLTTGSGALDSPSDVVFIVPGTGQYEITVSAEGYGFNTVTETVTQNATYIIQLPWTPQASTTIQATTPATQEVISIRTDQLYFGLALVFALLFAVTLVVLVKQRRSQTSRQEN